MANQFMWLLSHHNWITGQHLFKGSEGSFSKELIYVPDKVLLGRQRGVREDSSSRWLGKWPSHLRNLRVEKEGGTGWGNNADFTLGVWH